MVETMTNGTKPDKDILAFFKPNGFIPGGGTGPSLIIFNMLGKKVHEERVYRYQCAARIDVSDWPAGMYVATIFSHGQVKGKCKVVVSR